MKVDRFSRERAQPLKTSTGPWRTGSTRSGMRRRQSRASWLIARRGRSFSAQNEAAVHGQRLAGEGRGIVAGEHGHHSGGVIGGERPRQRLVRLSIGELGCRDAGGGGGVREAGATAVTAIPSLPSPTANARAMPIRAPLDAMYASMCAPGGLQKVLDTMKITRPKPAIAHPGANACVSSSADSTLTA